MAEVYTAADVFVLASRFDGWGAVLNEAASMGMPLIATDLCGAAWHLIKEGRNGVRVKAGSVVSLQRGLCNYIKTPDMIKSHGAASELIFTNQFTPKKNVERLMAVLHRWGIDAD